MADWTRGTGSEFLPGAFSAEGPGEMTPARVSASRSALPMPSGIPRGRSFRLVKPLDRPAEAAADEHGHLDGLKQLATTANDHRDGEPGHRTPGLVKYLANLPSVPLGNGGRQGCARQMGGIPSGGWSRALWGRHTF